MADGGEDGAGRRSLIFVYGTLKRGFYNHKLLRDHDADCVGPHTTVEPFPLVCGPHGIPYLINLPGSGRRVQGELYSVSSAVALPRLDHLEGLHLGHYDRLPLAVVPEEEDHRVLEVEAYFAHRGFGEALWKRCGEEEGLLSEFSVELGEKYVPRKDRPPNSTFIQDISNFISPHSSFSN